VACGALMRVGLGRCVGNSDDADGRLAGVLGPPSPQGNLTEPAPRQYLFVDQLAEVTPWSAARIRNMICDGTFRERVHYFRGGWGRRPVFSWKAVVAFIEGGRQTEDEVREAEVRKLFEDIASVVNRGGGPGAATTSNKASSVNSPFEIPTSQGWLRRRVHGRRDATIGGTNVRTEQMFHGRLRPQRIDEAIVLHV